MLGFSPAPTAASQQENPRRKAGVFVCSRSLRCAASMSYPLTGAMPMGIDETARNPVQPSLPRSVPCCASPRRRGAQGRASPALHRPRRLPRRVMHAMFPSACCCTRWCRSTTGRQRAHRPLRPRDTSPAAQPKAKPQPDPMRPRSPRLGLGPLSGIGGDWPRTAKRHGPERPKSHAQTSDPPPNRRLCDRRLPGRPVQRGV